jgi:hypothetical protein
MAKLKVIEDASTEEPAAPSPVPLSRVRQALADAIGQRAPMTAEVVAIDTAMRRLAKLASERRRPTRLERKCQLIAAGPFNVKPNMAAINATVEREFKQGLLAA